MIHSHIAHFYALAAPDFVLGPMSDPAQRNILGVVAKVGLQIGGEVIKHRAFAQQIQTVIGGKATHPVCGLPGGMSKPITEDDRKDFEAKAKSELVLIDADSITASKDARELAGAVEAAALIISEGRSRRQAVKTALDTLKQRKANILGGILNNRVFPIPKFVYERV